MTELTPEDQTAIDTLMTHPDTLNAALQSIAEKEGLDKLRKLFEASTSQTHTESSNVPCISPRETRAGHRFRKGWGFRKGK